MVEEISERCNDAFLHAQSDGSDTMVRYVRGLDEMLTIRISDLPDGGYCLDIEKVGGYCIPACEGALELVLDKDLKEPPRYKINSGRVDWLRTPIYYERIGHPLD